MGNAYGGVGLYSVGAEGGDVLMLKLICVVEEVVVVYYCLSD